VSNVPGATGDFDDVEDTLTTALSEESGGFTQSSRHSFWSRLLQSRSLATTVAALILFVAFSLASPLFLTGDNLFNMVRNITFTGIVAVGMSYLLIAGEIDLSVGSTYGFLTMVMGILVARQQVDPWLAMLAIIILGALVGLINGLIVTRIGIPSFIVTLAMLTAYRSLAIVVSNQLPINVDPTGLFFDVTGGYIDDVFPWLIIWLVVIVVIGGFVLSRTKFGSDIYATGGDPEAARNNGINIRRIKTLCFMITSGLCGVVAALLIGYLHIAAPITGTGFEFRVIGAVIVGGVALRGGRGSIYGSFMGAIIIGMISSGLVLLGFSQYWGDIVTGGLIVCTGALDLYVRWAGMRSLQYFSMQRSD
jgi:ribose/xylose/arabinose/galactoside ABC-type transport system permease subunit